MSEPDRYDFAASRCVDTAARLRLAVEREGMTLDEAVFVSNLGGLRMMAARSHD